MAEKQETTEKAYTTPQAANPYDRVDEEVAELAARVERRKKRAKCYAYLAAFIAFQTAVFLIFGLMIMKVRTPRFRVRSASFESFNVVASDPNPSFNMRTVARLGIKNPNFGRFKYQNSTIDFYYGGTKVGEAIVPRGRAKARSTRKFNVIVDFTSANVPAEVLSNELRSNQGVIRLTSRSRVRGTVEIMKILVKKDKTSNMNCTMQIDVSSRQLGNISCRG